MEEEQLKELRRKVVEVKKRKELARKLGSELDVVDFIKMHPIPMNKNMYEATVDRLNWTKPKEEESKEGTQQ